MKAVTALAALALQLSSATAIDDGVSLLAVVLQNRSKVKLPPEETKEASPILIPLARTGSNATGGGSWRNSTYVGELFLGRPQLQRLSVTFDTASGQVILPSSRCRSPACRERSRYAPRASATSREINADGSEVRVPAGATTIRRDAITVGVTSIDHGSGRAYGDLIYDKLCFGGVAHAQCADTGFVGVTNMSDIPFRDMMQDGLVGLGLAQLAANPIFHVLSRLETPTGRVKRFSVFFGAEHGELALGGMNPARVQGDVSRMKWAPVYQPEDGYWQFALSGLRIGNQTLSCGSGCRGIIDTSAAGIGLPSQLHGSLEERIGTVCSGPDLFFDVKETTVSPGFTLTLSSKDYRSAECQPMITSTALPEAFADVIILGQPILRKFYTVFDWENRRLGFGLAAPPLQERPPVSSPSILQDEDGNSLRVMSCKEAEALETEILLRESRVAGSPWSFVGISMEAHALFVLLLQVLIMQVIVILVLVTLGGPRGSQEGFRGRLLFSRLGLTLQCWFGLDLRSNNHVASWLMAIRPVPAEEAPEASECVVCLGVREEECKGRTRRPKWCKLRCGHAFHQECISQWLTKVAQCPVCRSHIFDEKQPCAAPTPRPDAAP
mmetsp:Transcript_51071/g.95646  ORF Transcript_51071/g.95646 Transcript_51071/m.95646 type:complete len:611 (-) Transcript_51071:141-1973(-)